MMINCRFKPIDQWPGTPTPSWKRRKSQFKALWSQTLDLLERELYHLNAQNILIDGYFGYSDIRNDGWPKSKARPSQPGIVLSFGTKRGRITMPCDTYTEWEANLRAIALTLENLRAVERYGVTTERQEQYTGWLKLPAASADDEATACAQMLVKYSGFTITDASLVLSDQSEFERAWKSAARRTHPDTGGSSEDFKQVIAARDQIKTLKGWQ